MWIRVITYPCPNPNAGLANRFVSKMGRWQQAIPRPTGDKCMMPYGVNSLTSIILSIDTH